MPDVLTPAQRRFNMSRIRGTDTKPELTVRRLVHSMGFRYRVHQRNLPGRPDMVFSSRRKVIFVHGCFWHRHDCRYGQVTPRTNSEFWEEKISSNVTRDARNMTELSSLGWTALVIWECELKYVHGLKRRLRRFLARSTARSDHSSP
jgi:DNA mismatch endonuclease (patch repair protein)